MSAPPFRGGPRCPYCHAGIQAQQGKRGCSGCMAWHHLDCWREHGGCSACGTRATPDPEVDPAALRVIGACELAGCAAPVHQLVLKAPLRVPAAWGPHVDLRHRCRAHALEALAQARRLQRALVVVIYAWCLFATAIACVRFSGVDRWVVLLPPALAPLLHLVFLVSPLRRAAIENQRLLERDPVGALPEPARPAIAPACDGPAFRLDRSGSADSASAGSGRG